ncbi:hypothetical protein LAZ67_14001435, partial [Cordylochernes scorpioides]
MASLRSLESLEVTTDQNAVFLYPMVESSLPDDVLQIWQRRPEAGYQSEDNTKEPNSSQRLNNILKFIKEEIRGAERLEFVRAGFKGSEKNQEKEIQRRTSSTAAHLLNQGDNESCVFCDMPSHRSRNCSRAKRLTLEKRRQKAMNAKVCFRCLGRGHMARDCRSRFKCFVCKGRHVELMCSRRRGEIHEKKTEVKEDNLEASSASMANQTCSSEVLLMITSARAASPRGQRIVRILFDSGSQRSYIRRALIGQLNLEKIGQGQIQKAVFGGGMTGVEKHDIYRIQLENIRKGNKIGIDVLEENSICNRTTFIPMGQWVEELISHHVEFNNGDFQNKEIDILIGSDYFGECLTGRTLKLKSGPTAIETIFGWIMCGRPSYQGEGLGTTMITALFNQARVEELWDLEVLGIKRMRAQTKIEKNTMKGDERKPVAEKLLKSFYVDNCVTSLKEEEVKDFMEISIQLMTEAKMELNQWAITGVFAQADSDVSVLELLWDNMEDILKCNVTRPFQVPNSLTKSTVLSCIQRFFDLLGFLSPVLINPKVILQKTWTLKLEWDAQLPTDIEKEFRSWLYEIASLDQVRIPRCLYLDSEGDVQLHVFCDASCEAYASVVFARSVVQNTVRVVLLWAKARVAPLKRISIPRLELMACVLGAIECNKKCSGDGLPNIAAPEGFNFCKPNEWPIWFKRFQRYRIASGLSEKSENEQVNALIYIMGDKAEEILILFNLSEAQIDDYKLVVSKFQDYFIGKRNVIYERAKFNRRSQGETEPVEEFITNLYVLAETCSYGILKEEMIRDRLVVGVKNFNLSEKLQLESELTLEKAIQIVRQSESVKNQQKEIRQDTENRNVDMINRKGGRNGTIFQKTRMKGTKTYNSNFPKNPQGWSSNEKRKCFRCGYYQGHSKEQCPAKDAICNKCRKKGHFAKENAEDKWCEVIKVNDQPIKFKIDTGAEVSVMPEGIYLQHFGYLKTEKADKNLFAVSEKIEVNGMFQAFLESKRQKCEETIYIVKGVARPLLSCRASEILGLVRRINIVEDHTPTKLDPMLKFPKLFNGLGKLDIPYEIKLKEGAKPYSIYTPRRVPIPLMKELQMELERMTSNGVIEKVEGSSEWCSPMVLVAKPSGKLRICVDLSILNKNILREIHPIPVVEHTLAQLKGAKVFTKLDAYSGFWQIPLSSESSALTTFITPFGRFRFKRLPFGISSAADIFQKRMSQILEGLEGTLCHMDDIMVYGSCQEEHYKRLETVLTRVSKSGFTLNKDKCKFAVTTIKFLGHQIGPNGIQVDPKRKRAIEEFPEPRSVKELKQFLEMVNFSPRFVPNLAEIAHPMNKLLSKKEEWIWGDDQDWAFDQIKENLTSAQGLALISKSKDPYLALLAYRATPLANGFSPAELSMGRRVRTTIPTPTKQHQPPNLKNLKNQEAIQREKQKYYFDRAKGVRELPPLDVNDRVWLTDLKTPGVIISKEDTPRSYMVDTPRGSVRRNRFHLLPTGQRSPGPPHFELDEEPYVNYPEANTHTSDAPTDVTNSSTSPKEALYRTRSGRTVRRRGKPSTIYSDDGTNLVGTRNLFARLKWDKIVKETQEQRISWKLNPPTENSDDIIPLTPAMFLQDRTTHFPEIGKITADTFRRRHRGLQQMKRELRQRFRKEYLGLLVQKGKEGSGFNLRIGEIVLIGNDDQRRIDWPMAKIEELIPGSDGKIRVARIRTTRGILMRPIQKIYPLEVTSEEDMALLTLCAHTKRVG